MEDEQALCEQEVLTSINSGNGESSSEFPDIVITNSQNENIQQNNIHIGISWYKASFLIVNAALGAGLLNFPAAFDKTGGIAAGNLAHIIFLSFAYGSLIILAYCAMEKNCVTYQEVVKCFCGRWGGMAASVAISLYCFVTCITFIIIIGDQFDRAFASYFGQDFCRFWYMDRRFTMTISSVLLIFPCCLKRIDGMEFMSYVGVISIGYLVAVMVIEAVVGNYKRGEIQVLNFHILKFFNVVPTICFGYQCHVSSVPILSCLKSRERKQILKSVSFAMLVCFLVYTFGANSGYVTFGSGVNGDVLLDYDATKVYVLIAVLLLALKSWTTFPILLFCVREAIADLYIDVRRLDYLEAAISEPTRRKVIATVLWLSAVLGAIFIPNLDSIVKLLGSMAGLFIFVFPGFCLVSALLHKSEEKLTSPWSRWMAVGAAYVSVGAFSVGLAFALGVEALLDQHEEVSICVLSP